MLLKLLRRAFAARPPAEPVNAQQALAQLRAAEEDAAGENAAGENAAGENAARENAARMDDAIDALERVVDAQPQLADARFELAQALQRRRRFSQAVRHYRALLESRPDNAIVHNELANCLARLGRAGEAATHYRRISALQADALDAQTSVLGSLNYDPDVTPDQVFQEHRAWGRRIAEMQGPPRRHTIERELRRRLRVGYVSPDFKRHPVTYLFAPALAHHDHGAFEIFCYHSGGAGDEVTERLKRLSDHWRDVAGLDDEAFCEQVRADGIDILVDLAGHTTGGRLRAFARKPAPVQVSWLGYFNTTGLEGMDYFFSDPHSSPAGQERYFVERVLRLPDTRFCYEPPEYSPRVATLPARAGRLTFGCFNNLSKVNDRVMALWARVLDAVPQSRLRLMSIGLHDAANVDRFRDRFAEHGIAAERLDLCRFLPHPELLAAYSGIDIALDPFPFCGGMTSLEALWMGVPVITLEQPMLAGRQTLSFLRNLGLDHLVAADERGYVEAARQLAADLDALAELRAQLRPRMVASPLMDAPKFTRNLEEAYLRIMREHA